jgi:hypothetical protein
LLTIAGLQAEERCESVVAVSKKQGSTIMLSSEQFIALPQLKLIKLSDQLA